MSTSKKFKYTVLAGTTAIALCGSMNVGAVTNTLTVNAEIAAAITITTSALDFGTLSVNVPATGGSLVLATNGNQTPTGVVQAGTANVGHINISGSNNATVSVTLDTSTTLNGPNADTATADTFTLAINGGVGSLSTNTCTLSSSGLCNLNVGGTLTIPGDADSGAYTGSNTVTVVYN